ncbi:DUF1152 domain-containing protein [Streptomyces sp. NPDC056672]|uniref:DUF1152 domain-containing protein n=1 Tax=Streptomyces sp. NPDC056672 TaxID=3345906 RepID=UPI00369ECD2F
MTTNPRALLVGSGGSGDVVSAVALARSHGYRAPVFAVPLWERAIFDPRPGPRGSADVDHLEWTPGGARIVSSTRLPGGWSPLPELVRRTGIDLYLLDVTTGVRGLAKQLRAIAHHERADHLELVDAGGDIVARGDEPGLVSPALDAMLLAATAACGIRGTVTVVGAGLDGELTPHEFAESGAALKWRAGKPISGSVAADVYRQLAWFPSEASLLMLLAAQGVSGTVDITRGREPVVLEVGAARPVSMDVSAVARFNCLADAVRNTTDFATVDRILRDLGCVSEYGLEKDKLRRRPEVPQKRPWEGHSLTDLLDDIHPRADHVGVRRIYRKLALTSRREHQVLMSWLASRHAGCFVNPMLPLNALANNELRIGL